MKSAYISFAVAALVAAACAHDNADRSARGDLVGVNSVDAKSAPVTGSVLGGTHPAPSAMATTSSPAAPADTRTSIDAGMGTTNR
jgi:hypothetical protein